MNVVADVYGVSPEITCTEVKNAKGLFGSRVLEGRGGEIFNLKCLVQFLEGEGREGEESKSF